MIQGKKTSMLSQTHVSSAYHTYPEGVSLQVISQRSLRLRIRKGPSQGRKAGELRAESPALQLLAQTSLTVPGP